MKNNVVPKCWETLAITILFNFLYLNTLTSNTTDDNIIDGGPFQSFYIGTYTNGSSEGVYRCRLNIETGKLSDLNLVAKSDNPSFLALTKDRNYLLAVNETIDPKGNNMGYIESFSVSDDGDKLIPVNKVSSGGAEPCYISVNTEGYVLASNYTSGSVALFKLKEKGKLSPVVDIKQHHGSGPNKERQEGSHVHSAFFEPGSDRIFVADLGTDGIYVYHLDKTKPQLVPSAIPQIRLNPGSGPRHMAFHPKKKILYVVTELSNSVNVISLNKDGSYTLTQTISAIPHDYDKTNYCADIHISNDGRFLYVSNRGLNSIAIFEIDQENGKLTLIAQEPTKGDYPRNFTLSPDEKYLLVANEKTQNIVAFKRDKNTGKLTYTDQIQAQVPVCLLFQK